MRGRTDEGSGVAARLRARILGPSSLAMLIVVPLYWLGAEVELVNEMPLWALGATLVGAQMATATAYALWPGAQSGWRLFARVGVQLSMITVVIYAIGWGPTLVIGYLVGVADNIRASGSAAARISEFWAVVGIGLGQLAIFIGWAPSLLDEPQVHGLALLAALGLVLTIEVFGRTSADKERAESEALEAQERFRSAFEEAPIGVGLGDLNGRFLSVNRALAELLGYEPDDLVGVRVADLTHPDDWPSNEHEIKRLAAGEIPRFHLEKRYFHADGHVVWVMVSVSLVRTAGGEPSYLVGHVEDVTERKAVAEQLEFAAIHDPLTELPNRLLLSDRLALAVEHADRDGSRVGVVFLDLDRFKWVNDRFGHAAGDELLKLLSDRLRRAVRPGDTVARIGGDEFVVVRSDVVDLETVLAVARDVAEAIAWPTIVQGREVFVTASIGVALAMSSSDTAEKLLRCADAAMYRAKQEGRARIRVFDDRSHRQEVDQLAIGADLRHALERSELEVDYQPIVDLETGRVSGFEALVRWRHSVRGLLLPDEFVDYAEETGLIVPIGTWVLETACRQLAHWQSKRLGREPLTISVNFTPRQLAEPALPDELMRILGQTDIDPGVVWMELTEGALWHDAESSSVALQALQALRKTGIHLAVDDFGTGYSSLAHLKRFPVEMLKVDQTFVDGLGREADDTSIVGAVINLAHSLGHVAVAEGIETPLQLRELRTMGCDYGQGYLFGRPKPPSAVGDLPADDLSAWQVVPQGWKRGTPWSGSLRQSPE